MSENGEPVHSDSEVLTDFGYLGTTPQVSLEQTTASLDESMCQIYGEKRANSALAAHRKIFRQNYSSDSEMVNLSLEPPCSINL